MQINARGTVHASKLRIFTEPPLDKQPFSSVWINAPDSLEISKACGSISAPASAALALTMRNKGCSWLSQTNTPTASAAAAFRILSAKVLMPRSINTTLAAPLAGRSLLHASSTSSTHLSLLSFLSLRCVVVDVGCGVAVVVALINDAFACGSSLLWG
jgi:hypothetical protein